MNFPLIGKASRAFFLCYFLFLAHSASALTVVPFNHAVTGTETWTKEAGPYVVQNMSIASGGVLTINPGTIVKIAQGVGIGVAGTLVAVGTPTDPIVFTSLKDDAQGDDSNGDGSATTPQPGDWTGIITYTGGITHITNATLTYGGGYGGSTLFATLQNEGGVLDVADSTATNTQYIALQESSGTTNLDHVTLVAPQYVLYMTGGSLAATSTIFNGGTGGGTIDIFHGDGQVTIHQSVINIVRSFGVYSPTSIAVDMTQNYWGDPSGPTVSDNPSGIGASIAGNVLYRPFLGEDPTKGCVINCNSNVLFLPGIEASRLYAMDDPNCTLINCENQLWEPNRNDDVRKLFLDKEGKSTAAYDIYTRDVVDEVNVTNNTPIPDANIYKSFLVDLRAWKDTDHIIADYSVVPYDWRLSLNEILNNGYQYHDGTISYNNHFGATTSPYILQELRRLVASSRNGKVTIIAHSNGGLLTKALIKRLEDTHDPVLEKIDKIIFVDVPQLGTPEAIGALLHGYDQGLPKDWFPLILTPEVARSFASTSPMPYHLLPSAGYFNGDGITVRTPPVTFDNGVLTQQFINSYGHEIGNASELHNFLLGSEGRTPPAADDIIHPSVLDPSILAYAEGVHQDLDDNWVLPPSISLYQIGGWGKETVDGIRYWTGTECARTGLFGALCLEYGPKLQYTPEMVIDGDGTVVTPSALAMSTSTANVARYWVNLFDYNENNIDRKHADILEVPTLRNFIKDNILTQATTSLPTYIEASTPLVISDKRLRYFLHSPLTLSAQDAFGNEISASTSTIPKANYERFGEVQYISLPASSHPTLVLNGLAQGSFTLEIQEVQGDTITATTTFAGIPSATSTVVTMNFTNGTIANAGALQIDEDGNGSIDLALSPKLGAIVTTPPPDLTPPEALLSFATETQTLLITGQDASSSISVLATSTSTTITDASGNTLRIPFLQYKEKNRRIILAFNKLVYNGNTTTIATTTLKYKWNTNKKGEYTMFATYIKTASSTTEAHYRPKKNITVIMTKATDFDDTDNDDNCDDRPIKQKLPGMVVLGIQTSHGNINVNY